MLLKEKRRNWKTKYLVNFKPLVFQMTIWTFFWSNALQTLPLSGRLPLLQPLLFSGQGIHLYQTISVPIVIGITPNMMA
jgi:hypothetical protein